MASNSSPSHVTVHDETSPLLEAQHAKKPEPTPIPKGQLAAVCTVSLVDPIVFSQLFPYVNEFMSDLHLTDDPSRIGFYSGLVESTFAMAQLCSIYQWARLSDVIGRRPVILTGMLGVATTTVMFGLSKSLSGVLFARCVGGLFSGNIAVIHSVLGEITDSTNQAVAFPIYGIIWPLGTIIGPLIGGSFSHPASKYPVLFGYELFENYPYSLPCFIAGSVAIVGVILGYAFLEETLPSKRRKNHGKASSETNVVAHLDTASREVVAEPMSMRNLLALPIMSALAISGFALSFVSTSFDVVFVLFCYSPVQSGGLAFSASQIGYALATAGAIGAAIQVFIMSYLLRTFDCAKMYNFCMALWPYTYLSLPILNLIARHGLDEVTGTFDGSTTAMLCTGFAIVLGMSKTAGLSYSLSLILTKENSPNPAFLGQSNGIVQFAMCFARSFAPFVVSSLFALSIDNNWLGGYLWVVIMVFVAFLSATTARRVSRLSKRTVA